MQSVALLKYQLFSFKKLVETIDYKFLNENDESIATNPINCDLINYRQGGLEDFLLPK